MHGLNSNSLLIHWCIFKCVEIDANDRTSAYKRVSVSQRDLVNLKIWKGDNNALPKNIVENKKGVL